MQKQLKIRREHNTLTEPSGDWDSPHDLSLDGSEDDSFSSNLDMSYTVNFPHNQEHYYQIHGEYWGTGYTPTPSESVFGAASPCQVSSLFLTSIFCVLTALVLLIDNSE